MPIVTPVPTPRQFDNEVITNANVIISQIRASESAAAARASASLAALTHLPVATHVPVVSPVSPISSGPLTSSTLSPISSETPSSAVTASLVIPTTTSAVVQTTVATTPAAITALPTVAAASGTTASSADSTSHKSGTSSAAIGVTVTIFIIFICAASFFIIRKRAINARKKLRGTWRQSTIVRPNRDLADLESASAEDDNADNYETIDIAEKTGATQLPNEVTYNQVPITAAPVPPPKLHPGGYAPPRMPSPPPVNVATFADQPAAIGVTAPAFSNNFSTVISTVPFSTGGIPRASVVSTTTSGSSARGTPVGAFVIVARTFVPTLPDELSIQTGEQIRVISRYDDGWAHVGRMKNGGYESGVVPLECLESVQATSSPALPPISAMGFTQEAVESWRLSKRKSSLQPAGPVQY